MNYKGYRVGSIEKSLLKIILRVKDNELPVKYSESFSDILKTVRQKSEYSKVVKRMVKKGFIRFINKNGELKTILTNKGKAIAQEYLLYDYKQIKKPLNWDKKWRLVMFDIPEYKRKIRNLLRFHLKKVGFAQMQGSVWIYPYPCEEIVVIIKTNFKLSSEVIYITADSFEKDIYFRKIFKI
jgi:DNA-binding transcriptional regulator PaaX